MAENNSTEQTGAATESITNEAKTPDVMKFTSTIEPLYMLSPDATKSSIRNQISAKICQLEAMLLVLSGDVGQAFREDMSELAQDSYMWSCSETLLEIKE